MILTNDLVVYEIGPNLSLQDLKNFKFAFPEFTLEINYQNLMEKNQWIIDRFPQTDNLIIYLWNGYDTDHIFTNIEFSSNEIKLWLDHYFIRLFFEIYPNYDLIEPLPINGKCFRLMNELAISGIKLRVNIRLGNLIPKYIEESIRTDNAKLLFKRFREILSDPNYYQHDIIFGEYSHSVFVLNITNFLAFILHQDIEDQKLIITNFHKYHSKQIIKDTEFYRSLNSICSKLPK